MRLRNSGKIKCLLCGPAALVVSPDIIMLTRDSSELAHWMTARTCLSTETTLIIGLDASALCEAEADVTSLPNE